MKRTHLDELIGSLALAFFIGKNAYDSFDYARRYEISKSMEHLAVQWIDDNIKSRASFTPEEYEESIETLTQLRQEARYKSVMNAKESFLSSVSAFLLATGGIFYLLRKIRKKIVS